MAANRNLIGRAFGDQTPEEFYERVKGLYKAPEAAKPDGPVSGVVVRVTKRGIVTVKCTRPERTVTLDEVTKLADDCGLERSVLEDVFVKRKFDITNEEGIVVRAKPKRQRASRRAKPEAERDAHLDDGGREVSREDQLLEPRSDSDVHAEGVLQPKAGPETE